jgi:hypothetical protein
MIVSALRAAVAALVPQSTDSNGCIKEVKSIFEALGNMFSSMTRQVSRRSLPSAIAYVGCLPSPKIISICIVQSSEQSSLQQSS